MHDLEEFFGTPQVLQAMRAEITQADLVRQYCGCALSLFGQQDLAAMSSGANAGHAVNVQAHILVPDCDRLAGMQAHAHPEWRASGPAVRRQ